MVTARKRLGIKKKKKTSKLKSSVKSKKARKKSSKKSPPKVRTASEIRHAALTKGDLDQDSYQSPSSIETFLNCAKKWEFAYAKGLKMPPGIAMQEGSAHHQALHMNNACKIEYGVDCAEREVVTLFSDDLKSRTKGNNKEQWDGETFNSVQKRGKEIIHNYMREFAPQLKAVECERFFKSETIVPGIRLGGFIDVETRTEVADYKVTNRAKSQRDVACSVQLAVYAAATRKRKVSFISLSKQTCKTTRATTAALPVKTLAAIVRGMQDAIKKGAFPMCSPSNFLCSPKFCGYWQLCRGKYGG